jgi:Kef-type K+ transport system membrane component KefB
VSGVASGFLVPVFFVVLGASLDLRALVQTPKELELAAALIVGIPVVHVLGGMAVRAPVWVGLVVSAQLGVPAAIVKLGLAGRILRPGEGGAIIVAALASLGICAAGAALSGRSSVQPTAASGPAGPLPARGAG